MLQETTLFGTTDKVQTAINRLRAFEPKEGYILGFSGGKDSQTAYHLAKEAGVKFEAHYHLTTVDPPEVVYFIRDNYPDVIVDRPPLSMWQLIERKMIFPTRIIRFCCSYLKEGYGQGRTVVTGVRWAESVNRRNKRAMLEVNTNSSKQIMLNSDNDEARRMFEVCALKGKHILNPIIDWSTENVWEYLNNRGIPYCSLYDEGWTRLGCIACPMSGEKGMLRDFARWPKYYDLYLHAAERMLAARDRAGMETCWPNAQAVMDWWIHGKGHDSPEVPGQLSLFDSRLED